ncbi:hypothetical protein ZOSMA_3G00960 [Zostera marina]|uniref:chalcone synthase n=1 Tax=Zostera marina TaxID=29655 RepID=A0A0K9P621_ZOSMR|nr:hypothetical protein ZOSMA_3G00960 [Zostera marina]
MPGADYRLAKLLGLRPSVKRFMMYQQGCFGGGMVLRLTKDIVENNCGARVLVVCSELTAITFRGSSDKHLDNLVGQALFGDGAAAVIVGADPDLDLSLERPLFQLISASQTVSELALRSDLFVDFKSTYSRLIHNPVKHNLSNRLYMVTNDM